MPDWKSELKKIADTVAEIIRGDPYPEEIFPAPLRDAVRAYPLAGGKRLRPALLMWSCGMFGTISEQFRWAPRPPAGLITGTP